MKQPSIDELLEYAPSKYALATVAAKRAKEVVHNRYEIREHQAVIRDFTDREGEKPISMALCELAEGKIPYHFSKELKEQELK